MYLGWYDANKKKPARQKLAEAIERHIEKFGVEPKICLTSSTEASELLADKKAPSIAVRSEPFMPRWTFYVGVEDEQAAATAIAA